MRSCKCDGQCIFIICQFRYQLYFVWSLSVLCRLALDDLWCAVVCFQPHSLLIGKVWIPVMHFRACGINCKVHWRVGRRQGLYGLIFAHPLIWSIIRELSKSSVLGVLYVLCDLYWHSFYQIDHSTLWWRLVGVNCLTSCQQCCFGPVIVPPVHLGAFFHSGE